MRYAGIDLHKRSLTVCVIDSSTGETFDRRFNCSNEAKICDFFTRLKPFEAVIEASASYEWLWLLLAPVAERLVLAHPKKLRIIAESMKKSDRHDAYFLAWLLSLDSIPEAHRPSPRRREYQQLVRHRRFLIQKRSSLRTKVRSILTNRNLDSKGLFSATGRQYLDGLELPEAERFCVDEFMTMLASLQESLSRTDKALRDFRKQARQEEREKHAIVTSVPGVGDGTADIVLSSLGDVNRFPTAKKCTAYSGLVPGFRESDRTRHELQITKEGPRILRWALVQAAWRAVRLSKYWCATFERIAKRRGRKKAIVAVARRLLAVIYTLLKSGKHYVEAGPPHAA
jgi:transposase